ncbi:hypothetical protein K469DRAFT_750289 [Zopfia rhizophila CBS 207.26]|uniref:Uncharacterized protein n=1 Tax=Zopfia rhizophila CBS 207.26 TaxID=1314779 RepID=A0A6A6E467_9PEZI|nr:hypothetical protein K469DRAFT_750289 [Zopfia rhizophila CBS 207.26]
MRITRKRIAPQRRKAPLPPRQHRKKTKSTPKNVGDTEVAFNVQLLYTAARNFFACGRLTQKQIAFHEKLGLFTNTYDDVVAGKRRVREPLPGQSIVHNDNTTSCDVNTYRPIPSSQRNEQPPRIVLGHLPDLSVYTPDRHANLAFHENTLLSTNIRPPTPDTPSRRSPVHRPTFQVVVGNELISYKARDIQPPTRKKVYKNDIEGLLHDWEQGSYDLVNYQRRPIPIRVWRQIFRRSHPDFWQTYSKNYSEQKLVIGMYQSYSNADAFWADFSRQRARGIRGQQASVWERLPWKDIVERARQKRVAIDERAAAEARSVYSVDFNEKFSYRQGSHTKVYLSPRKIATKFRSLQGCTMPWDDQEDDQSSEE